MESMGRSPGVVRVFGVPVVMYSVSGCHIRSSIIEEFVAPQLRRSPRGGGKG